MGSIPDITAAKARVSTKEKGIAAAVDITLLPRANVAAVTQEASRVVIDTIQTDLGLPVVGVPTVKIAFAQGAAAAAVEKAPVAPPVAQKPPEAPPPSEAERLDEWFGASPPPEEPPPLPVETTSAEPEPETPPAEQPQEPEDRQP